MVASFYYNLTDYQIAGSPHFIGVKNYVSLFVGTDPYFYKSIGVTFYYVILSFPLQIVTSFFLALLLNRNIRGRSFFRIVFYLPTVMPIIASSMVWIWMFDPDLGLLNEALRHLHLPTSQWIYSSIGYSDPRSDEFVDRWWNDDYLPCSLE